VTALLVVVLVALVVAVLLETRSSARLAAEARRARERDELDAQRARVRAAQHWARVRAMHRVWCPYRDELGRPCELIAGHDDQHIVI